MGSRHRQRGRESAIRRRGRGPDRGRLGRWARIKVICSAEWLTIVAILLMLLVVVYVVLHQLGVFHSHHRHVSRTRLPTPTRGNTPSRASCSRV